MTHRGPFQQLSFCGSVKSEIKSLNFSVLGSARTGLIFQHMLGGDTARWADPNWPIKTGYLLPCAFMLGSGWGSWPRVGSGGGGGEVSCSSGVHRTSGGESYSVHFSVLYILLISIIVVTVPFVCCSVKLRLSQRTSFCLFLSILLPTPAGRGVIERPCGPLLLATAKLQHLGKQNSSSSRS